MSDSLCDGAVLPNVKLLDVIVVFVDGAWKSSSKAKSPVRHFLGTLYPVDMEESRAGAPEDVVSIDMLSSDLEPMRGLT